MSVLDRMYARAYDRVVTPAEQGGLADARAELLADLEGMVVEIGAGTGLNLPHVPEGVTRWLACEPEPAMLEQLRARAADDGRVEVVRAPGHTLPLDAGGADHAVCTLVLCTVADLDATVRELARVVRPGGTVALLEHVASDSTAWHRVQRVVQPAWKVVARGCHLTRDPRASLEAHGFDTSGLRPWTLPASPPLTATAIVGHVVRRG